MKCSDAIMFARVCFARSMAYRPISIIITEIPTSKCHTCTSVLKTKTRCLCSCASLKNRTYSRKSQMSLSSPVPDDTVVYHFSCARRVPEPDFIKKSTTFSEAGRRSRCVWHMTSASKRSSPIVARTSVNVLVTLLKVRSASAADTGSTARI